MPEAIEENQMSPEVEEALAKFNEMMGDGKTPQSDTVMDNQQKMGVIMTLITSMINDANYSYRQTLRTAGFQDSKQSRLAGMAISEAERYGAPVAPYINIIEAQNGERGEHGVRGQALTALTHYTLSMNGKQQKDGKRDRSKPL